MTYVRTREEDNTQRREIITVNFMLRELKRIIKDPKASHLTKISAMKMVSDLKGYKVSKPRKLGNNNTPRAQSEHEQPLNELREKAAEYLAQ